MRAPSAQRGLPDFVLTIAVFTFTGPLVGGLLVWIVWFAGVLWKAGCMVIGHPYNRAILHRNPDRARSHAADGLRRCGRRGFLGWGVGRSCAAGSLDPHCGPLLLPSQRCTVSSSCSPFRWVSGTSNMERLPYFPAAAGAHSLFPISLFAAAACWIVLQRRAGAVSARIPALTSSQTASKASSPRFD